MTIRRGCGCVAGGMVLGLALLVALAEVVAEVADGRLFKEPPCRCSACERDAA